MHEDQMMEQIPIDEERFEGMDADEIIEEMELEAQLEGDVQKLYNDVETMTFVQKVELMNALRIKLDRAKKCKTLLQMKYDAMRLTVIPSAMDDDGISSITVAGVGRVGLTADLRCSILKENRLGAYKWLRDNGHDIIQETVNSGTLKATMKAILKKGKEVVPTDLFKITPFTRASITKK